jgi:hypothetical protein
LINEFLDKFLDIKVDRPVKIRESCYPPLSHKLVTGILPVSDEFVDYINRYENKFVVKTIQENGHIDVVICVYEVEGILGYNQVLPYVTNKRVFNWRKS